MSDSRLRWNTASNEVICAICFDWTKFEDLYIDKDGQQWDICKDCGVKENV